ncbi:S8 family serine peptidase [Rossellomorea marisflavi]|uniref:S8 family serine peptidase n=1 Tax=Rossellomorea marisflavi TaxID=189381 RepID=UPI0009E633F1|nr:S8 family serine peptidase [Rossellomorea marisflavi]
MRKRGVVMKRILISVLMAGSIAFGWPGNAGASNGDTPDRVIVKLKSPHAAGELKGYGVAAVSDDQPQPIVTLEVPEGMDTSAFVEDLEDRQDVAYAEKDSIVSLSSATNDKLLKDQWHLQSIEAPRSWDRTMGSKKVVVAVVDNGVDVDHLDLKRNITAPYNVLTETADVTPGDHGTHVAGIIGAAGNNKIGGAGVAPNTGIMPVQVFDGEEGYMSDVVKGIQYAIDQHASIINLSLGSYEKSAALEEVLKKAHQMGILVIAAAGNDSLDTRKYPYYPASYKSVLSIAATDDQALDADFSNYGKVDLSAPGVSILSTIPYNMYGYMDGTSMAAPVVSGTAALVLAAHPNYTKQDVINKLSNTADWYGPKYEAYFGKGIVNARRALDLKRIIKAPSLSKKVYDHSTLVEGKTSLTESGKVSIKRGKEVIGTGKATNGTFLVSIPKQKVGATISVVVTFEDDVTKEAHATVLDGTPPKAPTVNKVGDHDTVVKGKAEAGSTVTVKAGSKKLGSSAATTTGTYSVKIAKQKAGTKLTVTATDKAKNVSKGKTVTVVDNTPPKAPSVNPVSPKATKVTGKAEVSSTVTVKAGKTKLGSAKADKKGRYSVTIKKQKKGKKLSVTATDKAKNKSKATSVTVK